MLLAGMSPVSAQTLYVYADDGAFIYSDHPVPGAELLETRELDQVAGPGDVSVSTQRVGGRLVLTAHNGRFEPVQFRLLVDALYNAELPAPRGTRDWILAPGSATDLLQLGAQNGAAPGIDYHYRWLGGDPAAGHRPAEPYRAPFALATHHPVTQAWPDTATHDGADSRYAVDIAMPVGTGVYAARAGMVTDTESDRFRSGLDVPATEANLVRILQDDGTFAVYAHLNHASIRVQAGDRVARGDYIADSGNTGYSSGPHLHFVVIRNTGFQLESVPVEFATADGGAITVKSGDELTAW